jgi:hypothetical protein
MALGVNVTLPHVVGLKDLLPQHHFTSNAKGIRPPPPGLAPTHGMQPFVRHSMPLLVRLMDVINHCDC